MPPPTSGRLNIRRNSLELLQYAKRLQDKYILHPYWINSSMGKIEEISQVPEVDIAEAGCCKYVLIEVRDGGTTYNQAKLVVRGDASCADHGKIYFRIKIYLCIHLVDVLEKMENQIDENKLTLTCKGGGRIQVDPGTRTISVYGYSSVNNFIIN